MTTTSQTVRPGQWLRHLTNASEKPWRYLEEIAPDPFGNPDMVVLKFGNGDGARLSLKQIQIVNDAWMPGNYRTMWEVSETEPAEGVATERTASKWLAAGRLVQLTERAGADGRWVEALLDGGRFGETLVEMPTEALDVLRDVLVPGVEVEVIAPALRTGVPGIVEVRTDARTWKSDDGIPVSRGFLNAYGLVAKADGSGCAIVPFVPQPRA